MTEKLPPPEGTRPMMISMREMETLGLKTGSGLRETVPYQVFPKAEILEQIAQIGFMCPFHEFRADLTKLQGDELLIVADPNEVYGENWLLCVTRRAYESQLEVVQAREREQEEEMAAQAKKDRGADEDADAIANIVYEDRPVMARAWASATARESHDDVEALSIHSSRQRIKISVTKMSDEFNAECKFSDRNADQLGFVEWRQHKDPNYELTRLEQDVGLQGLSELVDNATQTTWFRSVNSALQYAPIEMTAHARQQEMDGDRMQHFLARVLPLVEEALQQNETLDIFLDPFANLHEEDAILATKNENAIKELRSFTDLVYSKNKTLPAIDWHPRKHGVVAVAAAANVNFARRLDLLERTDSSYILVWNFVDLIHPQFMLEAPQDVLTLRYNPSQPHLVAGGLHNGQVLVWDVSRAEQYMAKTRGKATNAGASSASARSHREDESAKPMPPVKPLHVSYIDSSHRRPVADLMWLPAGMEVNNRGHVVAATEPGVHQFVTIAGDGQVCFWDLRFKDPRYRGLTRAKAEKGAPKDAVPEVQFMPIYAISLTKVDTAGELGLKRICLERPRDDAMAAGSIAGGGGGGGAAAAAGAASASAVTLSSRFFCGTEEGELVYADWRPHAAAGSKSGSSASSAMVPSSRDDASTTDSGGSGIEYVQWQCSDHFRATLAVSASPFFPSILLTVSESQFHLWHTSHVNTKPSQQTAMDPHAQGPIFASALALAPLSCAAFSPTRPAVVFVGRTDGILEIWDFMDQSHRASLTVGITACALTSIEFRPHNGSGSGHGHAANSSSAVGGGAAGPGAGVGSGGVPGSGSGGSHNTSTQVKQQLVAIGDQNGNLHIMEIPRALSRAPSGERPAMEAYFKREGERMAAVREATAAALQDLQTSGGFAYRGGASLSRGGTSRNAALAGDVAGKTADGDSAGGNATRAATATTTTVEDEHFKQMESEFCRDLAILHAATAPSSSSTTTPTS